MRSLSSALQTAIVQPVVNVIYLVRVDFDSGSATWNSGMKDLIFDGATYRAAGHLGAISQIQETQGIKAAGITITMSGIKPEILAMVKDHPFLDRKCYVYLAAVDENFTFDSSKCVMVFRGSLDSMNGTVGNTASITMGVKSRLADWERPRRLRYTDADQQKLYPGDAGMEFIPQLSQKKLIWPRAAFLPDPRD